MTFSYDFNETEEYGDFVTLTPGRYIFALTQVKKDTSKAGNPKAVLTLTVIAGNDAYIGGVISQHWPVSGKGAFRFRAMLKALGVTVKDRGKVALEKYLDDEFGARVTLQEGKDKNDAGETMWFHELNAILGTSQYEDLLEEEEDEDEYEDDDTEVEEADDDDEDDDEDDEGVSVEDLDDMSLAELKDLAEDWEVSTKPDKGKKKLTMAQMRRRLTAYIEDAGEEEEDEEDEDEDILTEEELDDMSLAELREVAKDNDVKLRKPPKGKKQTAARVRKALVKALFAEEDEDDDEEPF